MKTPFITLLFFIVGTTVFAQYQVKYEKEEKAETINKFSTKVFKENPKEAVITDFKVVYRMFKGEAIQGSATLVNLSYATSATMNVKLTGVTKDDLLKNTNEIYADFINDLKNKGYKVEVLEAEKIKAHKKFMKNKDAQVLNGTTFETTHKKMLQSITAVPTGVNAIALDAPESSDPSAMRGGVGGASLGVGAIINDLLNGREVLRISATITIDFFNFEKKGFLTQSKLAGAPQLHIGGQHITSGNISCINKKMIIGSYASISNKPAYIEETDWANDMKTTTDVEFLGSKLKNYDLPVNSGKYCLAAKTLAKAYLAKYFAGYEVMVKEESK